MSTISIEVDLSNYIDECIEAVRDEGHLVFDDDNSVRDYCSDVMGNSLDKIKEIVAEARNNVLYNQDISQDYKELYDKLDRVLFYE